MMHDESRIPAPLGRGVVKKKAINLEGARYEILRG
jgi:hypothetical protein